MLNQHLLLHTTSRLGIIMGLQEVGVVEVHELEGRVYTDEDLLGETGAGSVSAGVSVETEVSGGVSSEPVSGSIDANPEITGTVEDDCDG